MTPHAFIRTWAKSRLIIVQDILEMQVGSVARGDNVIVVDDVIATGNFYIRIMRVHVLNRDFQAGPPPQRGSLCRNWEAKL